MKRKMFVFKRDNRKEPVMFDKITSRVEKLSYRLNKDFIDPPAVTLRVINLLYKRGDFSGVTTVALDNMAAEISMIMSRKHPDYATLAARIAISNLHKETKKSFSEVMKDFYNFTDPSSGEHRPMVSEEFLKIVDKNSSRLNSAIIYDRDFSFDYFGFKVLEKVVLKRINDKVAERPQHMFMRVAVAVHKDDIDSAIQTYNLLSERLYMYNTTTLKYAGSAQNSLSSVYSLSLMEDSIDGIYDTMTTCCMMGNSGGSVGLSISNLRGFGSFIAGTNGTSNGLMPMIQVYNTQTLMTSGEPHKLAIYLEPWHSDIYEFLLLKRSSGKTEQRALNLNYTLWIPDLFMKRVEEDADWSLMCPKDVSYTLSNTWGKEFEELYTQYEEENKFKRKVKARDLWFTILESQLDCGFPSIAFKDTCNRRSNHNHLGTIKGAGYHGDFVGFTSDEEAPACISAAIALHMFVKPDKTFDFTKLVEVSKIATRDLDKLIDNMKYPSPASQFATKKHRPIAIGILGLADTFISMRLQYESQEARELSTSISEHIYYGALESSCEIAEQVGSFETYEGCQISKSVLQYNMCQSSPSAHLDWTGLRQKLLQHGVRNSLLVAGVSTDLSAQILGCNEGFTPYTSNFASREVSFGEFKVINPHLLRDLNKAGVWDESMEEQIVGSEGSIQDIDAIPKELKDMYKTAWEIPQKTIILMAIERGAYIDHSQSLDIHLSEPNYGKLTSMIFYSWKEGIKTMNQLFTKDTTKCDSRQMMNGNFDILLRDINKLHLSPELLLNGNMEKLPLEQEIENDENH